MATLLNNLISYWPLNESSGNAVDSYSFRDLTNTNTVGYAAALILNGANFGSSEGHNKKLATSSSFLTNLSGASSFSGWVKSSNNPGVGVSVDILDWRSTFGTSRYINIHYENSGGVYRLNCDVSGTTVTYDITLSQVSWTHIAYTCSAGGSFILYVNNVAVASGSRGSTTSTDSFALGGSTADTTHGFAGYMDECGIWNTVLSVADISSLYNSGAGFAYPFFIDPNPFVGGAVRYLVVAGGGTGGIAQAYGTGGGGGAGGYKTGTFTGLTNGTYPVVVGLGGDFFGPNPNNGGNSSFNSQTATGGGRGAGFYLGYGGFSTTGGSGGGAGVSTGVDDRTGSSGISGQGFAGGNAPDWNVYQCWAGGGGGGSQVGAAAIYDGPAGRGGGGIYSDIQDGTLKAYCGGGGGGANSSTSDAALGGVGGGGRGGATGGYSGFYWSADNAVDGTGGGGGGGAKAYILGGGGSAGSGGNGTVIIRYITDQYTLCTGGVKTVDGIYTVHTFSTSDDFVVTGAPNNPTTSDTISISESVTVQAPEGGIMEVLVVGGGGQGGPCGGGGGGGGLIHTSYDIAPGNHAVVVGAGGSSGTLLTRGANGGNSSVDSFVALGGGGGGGFYVYSGAGANGGSGGGGSGYGSLTGVGGTQTTDQGNAGGIGQLGASGGGGGAYRPDISPAQSASYSAGVGKKAGDGGTTGYRFQTTSGTPALGNIYLHNGGLFIVTQVTTPSSIICIGTITPTLTGTLVLIVGTGGDSSFNFFNTIKYGGEENAIVVTHGQVIESQYDLSVATAVNPGVYTSTFLEQFHGPGSLVTFKVNNYLSNPALVYTAYLYDVTLGLFYAMRAQGTNDDISIAANPGPGMQTLVWDLSRAELDGGPYNFDTVFDLIAGHTYRFYLASNSAAFQYYGTAGGNPYYTMTLTSYAGGGGGGGRTMEISSQSIPAGIQYNELGGGTSGSATNARPENALPCTGGGGGGGGYLESSPLPWGMGGNGGSGVVIFRYLTSNAQTTGGVSDCSGGVITVEGRYTVHSFCSSGTFVWIPSGLPEPECNFTYTDWSECVDGIQTREVIDTYPEGCVGGEPDLERSCPLPPDEMLYVSVGVDPAVPVEGYDIAISEYIFLTKIDYNLITDSIINLSEQVYINFAYSINVIDTVQMNELGNEIDPPQFGFSPYKKEHIQLREFITAEVVFIVNVHDTINISEELTYTPPLFGFEIYIIEKIYLTEVVTVSTFVPILGVIVHDDIAISEWNSTGFFRLSCGRTPIGDKGLSL